MYTEYYGFREKPFNIVPDPSFLYLGAKHKMALTYLEYGLMDGIGFILLTGEVGTGKTTIVKQLLKQIGTDIEVAVVFNTYVSSEQLLGLILNEFELKPASRDKATCLDVLNQFLIHKHGSRQRVFLIVDEAQNLSQEAMEEIRMLSNLQTDKESLLQILLVGQASLRARLQHPSLAQLSQRIAVSYHLAPLNLEETKQYIAHRLRIAGAGDKQPFTPDAVERIFHYSKGIPRTINILCDAGLVYAYADEMTTIDNQVIERVVQDKELGFFAPSPTGQDIQLASEDLQGNGGLLQRLEALEARVGQLSAMIDWQIQEYERRAESYKDTLVHSLETMLTDERKRSDRLLVKYGRLKDQLKLKKPEPLDEKVEPPVKKTRG